MEGRSGRQSGRRRSGGREYRKLDSNMEVANLVPEVLMDFNGLDAGYDGDWKRNQYATSHLLTSIYSSRLAAFTLGRYQHLVKSQSQWQ